jgi:protein SEY1
MESTLSPLFLGQLKNLHKYCLLSFKKQMLDGMKGDGYDFADIVKHARIKYENLFLGAAQEVLLQETHWSYDEELALFREEIGIVADQCRKDETKKMVNLIEVRFHTTTWASSDHPLQRNFKRQILEPVELALNQPTSTMWDQVLRSFRRTLQESEASYLKRARSGFIHQHCNSFASRHLFLRFQLHRRRKHDITGNSTPPCVDCVAKQNR